eukprot:scaffold482_cov247-Pinguiococcus_pyrenoidosus.AAC.33
MAAPRRSQPKGASEVSSPCQALLGFLDTSKIQLLERGTTVLNPVARWSKVRLLTLGCSRHVASACAVGAPWGRLQGSKRVAGGSRKRSKRVVEGGKRSVESLLEKFGFRSGFWLDVSCAVLVPAKYVALVSIQ